MILKLSLNTQVMWKIFMKILMNTIQINTAKYRSHFDNLIADMVSIRLNSTHDFIMKIPIKREIIETVI